MNRGPIFNHEKPRLFFHGSYFNTPVLAGSTWDINPNGKFLMMKILNAGQASEASPPKFNIVQNWFEELKQRVPVD